VCFTVHTASSSSDVFFVALSQGHELPKVVRVQCHFISVTSEYWFLAYYKQNSEVTINDKI